MTDVLQIGNTNYYAVRKGTHQYRIAEGKRLADGDYCWLLQKDADSGKTFFVNGRGVRRWHLPDIYITEKERQAEEEELRFRRQRKAEEEAAAKRKEEGGGAEGEKPDDTRSEVTTASEAVETKAFNAREKASLNLKPLREWEDPENRRMVVKYAKSVIAPYLSQGALDEKAFSAVVGTSVREFCAAKSKLGEAEKAQLKNDLIELAVGRMTEEKRKEEYAKMNEDLMEKVKRLDQERKTLSAKVTELSANEDKMKDEIFKLRAHKQDVLLGSFKRLTRAGLGQTYWKRWIHYKGVVEAQLHVRARERRALEMTGKIHELEEKSKSHLEVIATLQARVQKAEGRDIIATLIKQSGIQNMKRCFSLWQRWTNDAIREKKFFELRQQIVNCPNCELQRVEVGRVRDRLTVTVDVLRQKEAMLLAAQAEVFQMKTVLEQKMELIAHLQTIVQESNALASEFSQRCLKAEQHAGNSDEQIRYLQNEIDKVRFEYATLEAALQGGSAAGARDLGHGPTSTSASTQLHPTVVSNGSKASARAMGGAATLAQSMALSTNPALSPAPLNVYTASQQMKLTGEFHSTPAYDRSHFYAEEVDVGAQKLHKLILKRSKDERVIPPPPTPPRGAIDETLESAVAPLVKPPAVLKEAATYEEIPPPPPLPEDILTYHPAPVSIRHTGGNPYAAPDGNDSDDSLTRLIEESSDSDSDRGTPPPPPAPTQAPQENGSSATKRPLFMQQRSGGGGPSPARSSEMRGAAPTLSGVRRGFEAVPPSQHQVPTDAANEDRTLTDAELREDGKCEKCGFKKKLTQFCPKDGSRHLFTAFSREYRDERSLMHKNYSSVIGAPKGFRSEDRGPGGSTSLVGSIVSNNNSLQTFGVSDVDSRLIGLPPSREEVQKRSGYQGNSFASGHTSYPSATSELRRKLNLDPTAWKDPTATPAGVAAAPILDTTHQREVADLMRATRIAAENERQVRRIMGQEADEEYKPLRSVLDPPKQSTGAPSATGSRVKDTGRSKWGTLFDYNDLTSGTLGIEVEATDHIFGVVRGDHQVPEAPSRRYLQDQRGTPNLRPY